MNDSNGQAAQDVLWPQAKCQEVYPASNATYYRQTKARLLPTPIKMGGRNYFWKREFLAALEAMRAQ